jgi:adenylate cyclase
MQALARHLAFTKPASDDALRLLGRALELDPNYSSAKALAAAIYNNRVVQNWGERTEIEQSIQLAREALADHRDDPATLSRAALALAYQGRDFEAALAAVDRALMLNPNSAQNYGNSGLIRASVGDWRTSIDHFQKAIRLSPLDPGMGHNAMGLCFALVGAGRADEALPWGYKALQEMPKYLTALRALILALVELGRLEEAQAIGQRLLALDPEQTVSVMAQRSAFQDPHFRERLFRAMRTAGIPE